MNITRRLAIGGLVGALLTRPTPANEVQPILFTIKTDRNFYGTQRWFLPPEQVEQLRLQTQRPENELTFVPPIDPQFVSHIPAWGQFFKRRHGNRPHLGIDIYVKDIRDPNHPGKLFEGKKPPAPVPIRYPVDGTIIEVRPSAARAVENRGIRNIDASILMLGHDGRIYRFVHLADPTDYPVNIPFPKVLDTVQAGQVMGYVGKTGETKVYHLHLEVATEAARLMQESHLGWIQLAKQDPYVQIRGAVNPLDADQAGPIAQQLQPYPQEPLQAFNRYNFPNVRQRPQWPQMAQRQ